MDYHVIASLGKKENKFSFCALLAIIPYEEYLSKKKQ